MRWAAALQRRFSALRLTERIHRRTNFQRGILYIGARRALMGGRKWTPLDYFRRGEQGLIYDPSDLSTLFQDAAGTTPVTGIEQPVGLMLDKSGRGNHARQTTATSRPVLSARVNLLTKTEDFSNPVWGKGTGSITGNLVLAPNGTYTANEHVWASSTSNYAFLTQTVTGSPQISHTSSIWLKRPAGSGSKTLQYLITDVNISNGISQTFTVTETWQKFSFSRASPNQTGYIGVGFLPVSIAAGDILHVWGADLRPSDQAALPYQRVNTLADYDTAGFPLYLRTDGIDDFMVTSAIDFTGTNKMTVVTGLRKIGTAPSVPIELSTATNTNAGAFGVYTQDGTNSYSFASRGTGPAVASKSPAAYAPPITNVITGIANISAPLNQLRVDGSVTTTVTASQGSANFGNYPLYLFRRGGTSLPFNGNFYGLIIRGAETQEALLNPGQRYIAGKTGVVL